MSEAIATDPMELRCRELVGRWVQTYPARPHEVYVCIAAVYEYGGSACVFYDTLLGDRGAWRVDRLENVSEAPEDVATACEQKRGEMLSQRRAVVWQ